MDSATFIFAFPIISLSGSSRSVGLSKEKKKTTPIPYASWKCANRYFWILRDSANRPPHSVRSLFSFLLVFAASAQIRTSKRDSTLLPPGAIKCLKIARWLSMCRSTMVVYIWYHQPLLLIDVAAFRGHVGVRPALISDISYRTFGLNR